jgi:hypothetical protein
LCRNPDGTVRVFRNVGALGDFLEWFGINTLISLWPQYRDGQISGESLAREIVKDPFNKLAQSVRPDVKMGYELPTGTSLFPDMFHPRTRPRDEILVASVGLVDEYRGLKGLLGQGGERMRPNYLQRYFTGVVDPRANALHEMYDLREKFLTTKGRETPTVLKLSAARNMRLAAMAEDYEAFVESMRAYYDAGNRWKNFKDVLGRIDPIAATLNRRDEYEFVNEYLTDRQRITLGAARDYVHMLKSTMYTYWMRAVDDVAGATNANP